MILSDISGRLILVSENAAGQLVVSLRSLLSDTMVKKNILKEISIKDLQLIQQTLLKLYLYFQKIVWLKKITSSRLYTIAI